MISPAPPNAWTSSYGGPAMGMLDYSVIPHCLNASPRTFGAIGNAFNLTPRVELLNRVTLEL